MCLNAVANDEKVERVDAQNDYKTTNKNWTDKKKTNLFCEFCKSFSIPRKQVHDCSKEFLGNNKKDFLKNPPVTMIITW